VPVHDGFHEAVLFPPPESDGNLVQATTMHVGYRGMRTWSKENELTHFTALGFTLVLTLSSHLATILVRRVGLDYSTEDLAIVFTGRNDSQIRVLAL
jgi:hypothetical protein